MGLGYLTLGQPATTLSGGEAQRLKLSLELSKRQQGDTLYILDEPTTGLHWVDIQRLMDLLFQLRDPGNTVIVIEHNLDVINLADWIVDLGPGGGADGGDLVYAGPRKASKPARRSLTGKPLRNGAGFLPRYVYILIARDGSVTGLKRREACGLASHLLYCGRPGNSATR